MGILLPPLWSLVVDELMRGLSENGCYALVYTDGTAALISVKFPDTISELLQKALSMVQQQCYRTQLSINPQKMVLLPFTRKRDLIGLQKPVLSGHTLQLTTEINYPELTLDKGVTW
jgi:hypothetical protein